MPAFRSNRTCPTALSQASVVEMDLLALNRSKYIRSEDSSTSVRELRSVHSISTSKLKKQMRDSISGPDPGLYLSNGFKRPAKPSATFRSPCSTAQDDDVAAPRQTSLSKPAMSTRRSVIKSPLQIKSVVLVLAHQFAYWHGVPLLSGTRSQMANDAKLRSDVYQMCKGVCLHFPHNTTAVYFHRDFANPEFCSDFFV